MPGLDLARVIASCLPALAGEPVTHLDAGTDHDVLAVGDHLLRAPKHEDAARGLAVEVALLAWLGERLPIAVPRYELVVAPCAAAPLGLGGYRRLAGTPALALEAEPASRLDHARLGARLGAVLAALHASDVSIAGPIGVPDDDDPSRREWSSVALSDLGFAVDHGLVEPSAGRRWDRLLATPPAAARDVCLVHGDLAAEHVLVDAGGDAIGLIDWSDAHLGDLAIDVAGLVHWGGAPMVEAARAQHRAIDDGVIARACWLAACRALADLVFGVENERPAYVAAGQRALAHVDAMGRAAAATRR